MRQAFFDFPERLSMLLESINEACIILDPAWRFVFVNRHASAVLDSAPESLIGKDIREAFPEAAASDQFQRLAQSARDEIPIRFEQPVHLFGRWLEMSTCPSGEGLLVFFRDVSEWHRAEEALRRSEERLDLMLSDSGGGFWECVFASEQQGNGAAFTYLSPALKKVIGFEEDEFPNKLSEWRARIHPDDRKRLPSGAEKLAPGERRQVEAEFRIRHKDGSYRWLHSRGVLSRDGGGGALRWSGFDFDVTRRKREERERAQLAAIVESSHDAIIGKTLDGTILSWNAAAERLYGYSREEAIGQPMTIIIPPEERRAAERRVDALRQGVGVFAIETFRQRKDGTRVPVSLTLSPVRNDEGAIVAASTIERDISDRKRFEAALLESEDRFRNTFENAPVGITHVCVGSGRWLMVNQRFCDIVGYAREELLTMQFDDLTLAEDRPLEAEAVARLRSGEVPRYTMEKRYRRRDGGIVWVNLTSVLQRDPSGKADYFISIIEDITERRRAAEAVRESEYRFRTLTETLPQLVWTCRPDGSCDYLGRQWCEYTGIPEEDQLGYGWLQAVHPDDRDRVAQSWTETVAGRSEHDIDFRIRGADGSYRWFKSRALALRDQQGNILRWFGSNTDISAIVEARGEAERANEAKSRFLAAASHDLRQPLQAARIFLDLLSQRLADPHQVALAGDTRRALIAGENLLNALLDVSTLESGGIQPEVREFQVQHLLDALFHECRPEAEAKGLQLVRVPSRGIVRSDPVLLRRMLRNLLHNAIRYTTRGRVLLGCRRRGDALRIEVWDTGSGIPTDQIAAIFEDFHQLDNPERNRERGLGLGLSVVQRMARLLGHEVSVRSTPSRGSGFAISVPLVAETPRPAPAETVEKVDGRTHEILIIEDDGIQLMGLEMLLGSWGYRVLTAVDGDKALAKVRSRGLPPDLILSDLRLPGSLSGLDAIRRIRELAQRRIPGIILTGDTDPRRLREAKGSDLVLLHKPFDPANLGGVIEGLLKPKQAHRGRAAAS